MATIVRAGFVAMWLSFPGALLAQQVADTSYSPPIGEPAFAPGSGPAVCIDEAHFNFHTATGRYLTFATLMARDGFRVHTLDAPFSPETLVSCGILVIANALHERNATDWSLPTPSAFSPAEMDAVEERVRSGGALLLIADHMPFPGAGEDLARRFGFIFNNGFVFNGARGVNRTFRRHDGTLASHPVTAGVDSVTSFTGQAFRIPAGAVSLLTFPDPAESLMPEEAWVFDDNTARQDVAGWSQGGLAEAGAGRVAVFGEAAMFSAQRAGPEGRPMGMNAPEAGQNALFLRNVMHWLVKAQND